MFNRLVLIPTYNEKENIERILRKVFTLEPGFDVLVIDDNSPDGTGDIVKSLMGEYGDQLHILERTKKEGLGMAYIAGFRWALERSYDYIFEMDADFSHNPEDLPRLYEACANGADMSIGSRYVTGVNVVNWPMGRVMLSYFASKYVRMISGMPFHDATAGFVCYHRRVLETIRLNKIRFKGYAFQIEMKFKAWKWGFKIQEVPIIFTDRTLGESKMSKRIIREAMLGVIQMKLESFFSSFKRQSFDQ